MSVNIKNEKTASLIRELATLQGVSLVLAVNNAVEEKLAKEKAGRNGRKDKKGLAAWLHELSLETAPLMNDGRTSKDIFDELYDEETGLPK
jgi:hypothetical protein